MPFQHPLESIGKNQVLESSEEVVMGGSSLVIGQKLKHLDRFADTIGVGYRKND